MTVKPTDMLSMSDEDFSNLAGPPEIEEPEDNKDENPVEPSGSGEDDTNPEDVDTDTSLEDGGEDADKGDGEGDDKNPEDDNETDDNDGKDGGEDKDPTNPQGADAAAPASEAGKEAKAEGDDTKSDKIKAPEQKKEDKGADAGADVNFEEVGRMVMKPFKANGKTITLRTPEEAITLMQMGANYTKKLQDIQPYRKVLLMLQNNELLDEGKLSYLIDLDKKNPEAIKKLVKDAGIDPMDIDTESEPNYQAGNHTVTDEEANFRTALEDLTSSDTGKETLQLINGQWDQTSKELLWQSPEIMAVIHQQRENGIYDRISAEVDRQITLGKIPAGTPFIQAYQQVGHALAEAGAFGAREQPVKTQPEKVAERVVKPKPAVTNGDKASAASTTRSTPRKAQVIVNPLAMSDDDFLKSMENRL